MELAPGQYGWKFRFTLVGPPSMKKNLRNAGCKVKYFIKANIGFPSRLLRDTRVKLKLNVVKRENNFLSPLRNVQLTPHLNKDRPIFMTAQVISGGVRPSEDVPIRIKIANMTKHSGKELLFLDLLFLFNFYTSVKRVTFVLRCHITATAQGTTKSDTSRLLSGSLSDYLCPIKAGDEVDATVQITLPEKLSRKAQATVVHAKASVRFILEVKLHYGVRSVSTEHAVEVLGAVEESFRGLVPGPVHRHGAFVINAVENEPTPFYFYLPPMHE
jgi:hypothetical protein